MQKDHKKWVAEVFNRAAPQYGQKSSAFFSYFGTRLTQQVHIQAGQSLLDVATGRGAVLFPLAQAVGPKGKVIGIDFSDQMLKETAKEIKTRDLFWVSLQKMDAENLRFDDHSFDFVFCGFALFFFPHLHKALAEFQRVLKPGGALVVSTWGDDSELDAWLRNEISQLCKSPSLAISPLWSKQELFTALQKHFKNITISEEKKIFSHASPESWWESLWTHGTRALFEQLSPVSLQALHDKAMQKASSLSVDGKPAETLHVLYAVAKNG